MVEKVYQKKISTKSLKSTLLRWTIKNNQFVLTIDKIKKVLYIDTLERQKGLKKLLCLLTSKQKIVYIGKKTYVFLNDKNTFIGTVIGNRKGHGYFKYSELKEDVYLSKQQMKLCIHGDRVSACVFKSSNESKDEALIVKIFKKKSFYVVGRYLKNKDKYIVIPNDSRFCFKIAVNSKNLKKNVSLGSTVVVKITNRNTRKRIIIGSICKVLGKTMNADLAIKIALQSNSIPYNFSKRIKKEVVLITENFSNKIKKTHIDLRYLPFVTIDDQEAFDFDDAICCKKNKDCTLNLWVAISDVSHYIQPNSFLDREAKKRGTSIYFPSFAIPMFPKKISGDICSLVPKKDRLTLVCEIVLSKDGDILRYKHYQAVINSHARLTYKDLWNIWNGEKIICNKYSFLLKSLHILRILYISLRKSIMFRNKISFNTKEPSFILKKSFQIKKIYVKSVYESHELIELCMVLANIVTSQFLLKHNSFSLFRNHDSPDDKDVKNCQFALEGLGVSFSRNMKNSAEDYSLILKKLILHSNYEIVQSLLLRSMKPAVYSVNNRGHFALSLSSYTHFTSPIRRYPDLLVHREIKSKIQKKNKNGFNFFQNKRKSVGLKKLEKLATWCSFSEKRAEKAVREVIDWYKCDYMKNKIGQEFKGIIFSIVKFGFFVRINNLFIDGLVRASSLINDTYFFNNLNQTLVGKSSGSIFSIGDRVKIKVSTVLINERRINFTLISGISFYKKNRIQVVF